MNIFILTLLIAMMGSAHSMNKETQPSADKTPQVEKIVARISIDQVEAINKSVEIFLSKYKKDEVGSITITSSRDNIKITIEIRANDSSPSARFERGGGGGYMVAIFKNQSNPPLIGSDFFLAR